MINKIENWDKIEPNYGEFKKLPAGGYICQIVAVAMEKSKNGNDMITINYDIAEGEYKGYFMERYKNAPRTNGTEPKWQGKYYIVINTERIRKQAKMPNYVLRGEQSELYMGLERAKYKK